MRPLAKIRIEKGYKTQEELAAKLGTHRVNVARWEMGQRYPRPNVLVELSKVLGVPERELIEAINPETQVADSK